MKRQPQCVPGFALVPIRGRPAVGHSWQGGLRSVKGNFQPNGWVEVVRKQVIGDCEIAGRLTIARGAHPLVDGGEVIQRSIRFLNFGL